jgi:AcrR family transcriptional regulator
MSLRLPAGQRRDQLLAVALEVFARQGFHGTAMNDVAEAAGVTKPVLYQHFPSKRGLYLELLAEVGDRLLTAIAEATADAPSPRVQVERGVHAYFQWVADDNDSFRLLFGSGARRDVEFSEAVLRVESTISDAISPLIAADIDDEHRALLAAAIVGLAEATSRRLVAAKRPFDVDVVSRQVADLAYAGLRGVHRVAPATANDG